MQKRRLAWTQEQATCYLGWGVRFFLAAVLTAARLPGGAAPFALGCVAASGAGGNGMAALLGTGVGTFLFLRFAEGLAHLAAAVLLVTAAAAFHGMRRLDSHRGRTVCGTLLFLAVRMVYVVQSASPVEDLLSCLTACVLLGVSIWFYIPVLEHPGESVRQEQLFYLLLTVLCALMGVELGNISLGRILLGSLLMVSAWQRGVSAGILTGLCSGLLADVLSGSGTLFFAGVYGFAGLTAGLRSGRGRWQAALAYIGGVLVVLLPATDEKGISVFIEVLLALPVFLLIPCRALGGKRLQKPESEDFAALEGLRERLTRAAEAFHDLYESLGRGTVQNTEENPAVIFDRAAEKTCRDCALCSLCWKKEYTATFNAFNDATPFLLERGRVMAKDFPRHFADRCIHLSELMTAINTELSAYLLRGQYRRQLEQTRNSARGQYAQLGELLGATAAGLGEVRAASGFGCTYRIGAALRPKEGEKVCGDTVSSFEAGGRLCMLLNDGNGSGEGARRESALTNRLLRQFLEAGIAPEAALKTLNSALALRAEETGGFSTIDLLILELGSGQTTLYKYGAAPSYIKKGGRVRRITGNTLPAGLRESPAAPDVTRLTLEGGSFAVMVSDGVADPLGDEWLQNLLAGWDGDDPQVLAGLLLKEIQQRGPLADDCGVQVLYLESTGQSRRV